MAKHPHLVTISSMKNHPHHDILRDVLTAVFGEQLQTHHPKRDRRETPGMISLKFKGLNRRKWALLLEKITAAFTGLCILVSTEGKRVVNLLFPMPERQPQSA